MTPEEKARGCIDARLARSGWVVQDLKKVNPMAALGVAVREFPISTGRSITPFSSMIPPSVSLRRKKNDHGENITVVEGPSGRYANSTFKYVKTVYKIRFACEATGELTRSTDYDDVKSRSRPVFSFHRPETLRALLFLKWGNYIDPDITHDIRRDRGRHRQPSRPWSDGTRRDPIS